MTASETPPGLPPLRNIGHTIDTGDSAPISKPAYRLSPKEKAEVEKQVRDLLDRGLIRPSQSPYESPVLFVQEKDGSLRMCIDYRALNAVTVKDRYPLPRIDNLFDRLQGATQFSSLDLQSGYHQIRIANQDVQKTACRTHEGLYEFMVLPFGLTNAPAAFQREMKAVFDHLPFVLVYLDDILIFSKSEAEHRHHLCEVLSLLRKHELYAKLSKCKFFEEEEAVFLGHVVSKEGIKADPAKIAAIQTWPAPRNITEMRSFLGLVNHLSRYIKDYALLSAPLHELTRPSLVFDFDKNEKAQKAFAELKKAMSSAPVLAIADEQKPYELVCDACGYGIGAVLMQEKRPLAYVSYKLNGAERNYPTGEQELLAVVKSLERWRSYLEGCGKLSVVTDHKPNTFLNSKPPTLLSRRQVRWQQFLARFDFEWEYRKGAYNIADPLSRNPNLMNMDMQVLSEPSEKLINLIKESYAQDPYYSEPKNLGKLKLVDGLYYEEHGRILIPKDTNNEVRKLCIEMHHDPPYMGRTGRDGTLEQIKRHFVWPHMAQEVKDFVATCDKCQRNKASNQGPQGLNEPLQVPEGLWKVFLWI